MYAIYKKTRGLHGLIYSKLLLTRVVMLPVTEGQIINMCEMYFSYDNCTFKSAVGQGKLA